MTHKQKLVSLFRRRVYLYGALACAFWLVGCSCLETFGEYWFGGLAMGLNFFWSGWYTKKAAETYAMVRCIRRITR